MSRQRLLPHTDAIPRGTIEWRTYNGRYLVRYNDLKDYMRQEMFPHTPEGSDAASEFVERCKAHLKLTAKERFKKWGVCV